MPTVHTIGFGYEIRSGLLQGIAEAAGGNYAFIPDSGMIGTVFVNAIANLYTTFATSATLTLTASGSSALELKPLEGAALYADHGDDLVITLSNLQFGQSRDVFIKFGRQGPRSDSIVIAKLEYTKPGHARQEVVATTPAAQASKSLDPSVASYHLYRAKLCQFLASHFIQQEDMSYEPGTWNGPSKQEKLASLASELKSCGYNDDLHKSLLEDLNGKEPRGQIRIAVSEESYFRKWGMHYLPSLLHAHRNQMRNTFKDPGPLQYGKGSTLFVKYNKELNELFNDLDVWPGSLEPTHMAGPHGSHYDAQYVHPSLRHGISMARYNSADNPCFAGHCTIALASGASVPIRALRAGATVQTPVGARRVVAVVKTHSRLAVLCRVGKLCITPWHPVLDERSGAWVFPAEMAECSAAKAASVYSVMLEPATEAEAHAVWSERAVDTIDALVSRLGHAKINLQTR
ncbi:hypothetical protein PAAG_11560 [Neofusicoccum parvum]|nr:hypothetical protein PAAG_11560 [Neofusicoccum parvum]